MPRVVHIIDSLSVGGAQRLLTILGDCGLNPTIIDLNGRRSEFSDRLEASGATVIRVGARRALNPLDWLRVYRALRKVEFDLAHLHLTNAVLFGAPIARLFGRKVVSTLHNTRTVPGTKRLSRLKANVETLFLRHLTHHVIHVGSNVEAANKGRLGGVEQTVLPNVIRPPRPISAGERAEFRAGLGAGPQDVVFVATGRLSVQKDHETMFRAMALVATRNRAVRLWVAGDGDLRDTLARRLTELGIDGVTLLLGTGKPVELLLGAGDIFLLSSAWEGLPLGLLEAMAAGMPVAATNVGDLPSVLGKGGGLMVPKSDPVALAEAMETLAGDAELRATLGRNAQAAVATYLDVQTWIERTEAVYKSVLGR